MVGIKPDQILSICERIWEKGPLPTSHRSQIFVFNHITSKL